MTFLKVLSIIYYVYFCLRYGKCKWRNKTTKDIVYAIPNIRIGKRIPLQSVPDEAATHRNSARTVSYGETNQNLVPESSNEMEKGT